ncbi:hypothetical protein [Bradyrhizobium sp. SZCCHNPS1003]|uniref:hypothetical protein n=1 Tax=Bradyrhizobium sp. SZCCHNPS1003 TaxID=3057330 RepID=UPI0028EA901E|nr:hypothetical protein [Bradyrhizobium sp. SZCCHNPS1003]
MNDKPWWRTFDHPFQNIKEAQKTHGKLLRTVVKVPLVAGAAPVWSFAASIALPAHDLKHNVCASYRRSVASCIARANVWRCSSLRLLKPSSLIHAGPCPNAFAFYRSGVRRAHMRHSALADTLADVDL